MARLKKTAAVVRTDRIDVIIAKLNEIIKEEGQQVSDELMEFLKK